MATSEELVLNLVAQSLRNIGDAIESLARVRPMPSLPLIANTPEASEDDYMTTEEAARYLRTQPNTLAIWRLRGTGPRYAGIGNGKRKTIRYAKSDLQEFLRNQTR